jgi:hypothetical protein
MKFLGKFYNHVDIPWFNLTWPKLYHNSNIPPHDRSPSGYFWHKDIIKLFGKFKDFTICHPNSGASTSLWKHNWTGQVLESKYPHIFSFSKKANCSFQYIFSNEINQKKFLLLSVQASQQLTELQEIISDRKWDQTTHDIWHYSWELFSPQRRPALNSRDPWKLPSIQMDLEIK